MTKYSNIFLNIFCLFAWYIGFQPMCTSYLPPLADNSIHQHGRPLSLSNIPITIRLLTVCSTCKVNYCQLFVSWWLLWFQKIHAVCRGSRLPHTVEYFNGNEKHTQPLCVSWYCSTSSQLGTKIVAGGHRLYLAHPLGLTNNRCCSQAQAEAARLAALALANLIGRALLPLPGTAWEGGNGTWLRIDIVGMMMKCSLAPKKNIYSLLSGKRGDQ